jgi:F420-non-reducing hydrogenase iron-sulfur subunit
VNYAKKLLAEVGLAPERLEMFFLSSAEGVRFAQIATEMTERARQLGPNPLKNGQGSGEESDGEVQNATTD